MPYVREVPPEEATGYLKEIYDRMLSSRGAISNLVRVQSLRPDHLKRSLDFATPLLFGESELTRVQRELIATTVSSINRCRF